MKCWRQLNQRLKERSRRSKSKMESMSSASMPIDRIHHSEVAAKARLNSSLRSDATNPCDIDAVEKIHDFIRADPNILDTHEESQVGKFYDGRSILLTGASGFVGKCILEKLLRSCPTLKSVYILLRPKRGLCPAERLKNLVQSELFERLRKSNDGQKQLSKIIVIEGDITRPLFGLNEQDIKILSENISLIFHSAATVRFVEPLKTAIENNVISIENLVNLASKLKNLEALIHISTAYSNCDREKVDEIFYEPPIEADKLIDMSRWMDPEMFESIAPILIGQRPNTYTFTKAVAESLLVQRTRVLIPNVPIGMIRPSIVGATWRQPLCGWVDNFNGPTGVIISLMTGAIQAMLACPDYCADIVPVDVVANLIICAAWQVHTQHHSRALASILPTKTDNSNKTISIFNCVSGTLNPVAWSDFAKYVLQVGIIYPCNNLMRRPAGLLLSSEFFFKIYNFFNHTATAHAGDFLLKVARRKPKLVPIHDKLMKMIETLKPFTMCQWSFKCSNVTHLYENLTPADQEIFNFDIRQVRWDDYIRRYYIGSKIFALKDDPNKVIQARQSLQKMKIGNRLAQIILIFLAYYFLLSGSSTEEYFLQNSKDVYLSLKTSVQSMISTSNQMASELEVNSAELVRG